MSVEEQQQRCYKAGDAEQPHPGAALEHGVLGWRKRMKRARRDAAYELEVQKLHEEVTARYHRSASHAL